MIPNITIGNKKRKKAGDGGTSGTTGPLVKNTPTKPPHKHVGTGELEKEYLEEFEKGRITIAVGTKGSGKSYTANSYLKYCLENDIYDVYLLSLPVFQFEQNGSYEFINKYKGKAQIVVYSQYDPMIFEKAKSLDKKIKKFIFIDDATGGFNLNASASELTFMAQIRHFNCSLWIVLHVIRNALPETIRACVDFVFVHLNTNKKGLESLWEEYLSLPFPNFKTEFMKFYKENVLNKQYNSMLIFCREVDKYSADTNEWKLVKDFGEK